MNKLRYESKPMKSKTLGISMGTLSSIVTYHNRHFNRLKTVSILIRLAMLLAVLGVILADILVLHI